MIETSTSRPPINPLATSCYSTSDLNESSGIATENVNCEFPMAYEQTGKLAQPISKLDLNSVITKFNRTLELLAIKVRGYSDHAQQFKHLLAAREHIYLFGEPGEGKSLFANSALNCMAPDIKIFKTQLDGMMLPEHVFGAYDPILFDQNDVLQNFGHESLY